MEEGHDGRHRKFEKVVVRIERLQEMILKKEGICINCEQVDDGVDPKTKDLTCWKCFTPNVFGAEEAVVQDLLHIDASHQARW